MVPTALMANGGIASVFFGVGVVVGYFIGRRSRKIQVGFPVIPPEDKST